MLLVLTTECGSKIIADTTSVIFCATDRSSHRDDRDPDKSYSEAQAVMIPVSAMHHLGDEDAETGFEFGGIHLDHTIADIAKHIAVVKGTEVKKNLIVSRRRRML